MFFNSKFNKNISDWDISNVESMECMFQNTNFDKDLSKWNTKNLINIKEIFDENYNNKPYWYFYENKEGRNRAIASYNLSNNLNNLLNEKIINKNKVKI